jgi:hypothetical protein
MHLGCLDLHVVKSFQCLAFLETSNWHICTAFCSNVYSQLTAHCSQHSTMLAAGGCCSMEQPSCTTQLPTHQTHGMLQALQHKIAYEQAWQMVLLPKTVHSYSECSTHCQVRNGNIPSFCFEGDSDYHCVSKTTRQTRLQTVKSNTFNNPFNYRPGTEKPHVG